MKGLLVLIFSFFLVSCAESYYYQVYKTETESGSLKNNNIVFEDENCTVNYNLWTEGGKMNFTIYNKTKSDLTVDLTKTFFVLNGIAFEYFQNRTYTESENKSAVVSSRNYNNNLGISSANSSGFSTSFVEKPRLIIPSNTRIIISENEYNVNSERYQSCDLIKFPSRREIKKLNYTKDNTPFNFYNLITYSTNIDTFRFENRFHVSEIANYPISEMYTYIDSTCGKRRDFPVQVLKELSPFHFYIIYSYK